WYATSASPIPRPSSCCTSSASPASPPTASTARNTKPTCSASDAPADALFLALHHPDTKTPRGPLSATNADALVSLCLGGESALTTGVTSLEPAVYPIVESEEASPCSTCSKFSPC